MQDNGIHSSTTDIHEHREFAKTSIETKKNPAYWQDYKQLRDLRNALAHGSRSKTDEAKNALRSKDNLNAELNRLFKILLP
jgi:hypothetical protein